jgi:hypothetical protein
MTVASRQELIDYCLRRLGFPVIEINVDEDQIEDRIDDALQYFQEFHFDGVERLYLTHQVTTAELKFSGLSSPSFEIDEILTGATSGATCKLFSLNGTNSKVSSVKGTFVAGETVTGSVSGFSRALASTDNFYTPGDIQNGYIPIPDSVIGVIRVLPVNGPSSGMNNRNNMFDIIYQFRLNDMYNLLSADMVYYTQVQQHLSMLDMLLVGDRSIRYNRKMDKMFIDVNWEEVFDPGDYVIVECYRILDPNTYTQVYNDRFLKTYATALIKKQWGDNMKKFGGMQLPGGIVMNGQQVYDEAVEEIRMIQQDMQLSSELPVDFMVG